MELAYGHSSATKLRNEKSRSIPSSWFCAGSKTSKKMVMGAVPSCCDAAVTTTAKCTRPRPRIGASGSISARVTRARGSAIMSNQKGCGANASEPAARVQPARWLSAAHPAGAGVFAARAAADSHSAGARVFAARAAAMHTTSPGPEPRAQRSPCTQHIHSAHKTTKGSVLTKIKSNVDSMWEGGKDSARGHQPSGAAYAARVT
eukprot:scaffold12600_cov107-Isochrysis_galbana.AAC.6